MFGFLLKIIVFAAIVVGAGYLYINRANIPQLAQLSQITSQLNLAQAKNISTASLSGQLSEALDNLVTHPDKNSPVVLGVKITNESLGKIVDVIQSLPPDQINQLRQVICSQATPSAR